MSNRKWYCDKLTGEFDYEIKMSIGQQNDSYVDFLVIKTYHHDNDVVLRGSIKWDGCANIEPGYIHLCGSGDAKLFSSVYPRLWEIANSLIPSSYWKDYIKIDLSLLKLEESDVKI
jgi:hypothetical protein